MKLRDVIQAFRREMLDLGYTEFRDESWSALFCKILDNGLFLTLGFQMSSLYFDTWTANLYIGTTTDIAAILPDIPISSYYARVPNLLNNDEKEIAGIPCVQDYWWTSIDVQAVSSFCKALQIGEAKLTSDADLVQYILKSKGSLNLKNQTEKVIKSFLYDTNYGTYNFCPEHDYREISVRWFQAAENVLKKDDNIKLSKANVWDVALRVYREYTLMDAASSIGTGHV